MKFTNIFTFILLAHAIGVGALLLVQSGCHQGSFEVEQADTSAPIVAPKRQESRHLETFDTVQKETHGFDEPMRTSRFAPQRPIAQESVLEEEEDEDDDIVEENIVATPAATPSVPLPTPTRVAQPQQATSSPIDPECIHVVKAGESLWKIANQHNLTLGQLLEFNKHQGLTKDSLIRPGQQIVVASLQRQAAAVALTMPASTTASTSTGTYRVQGGDTLIKIARRNAMAVDELKSLNGLKSDTIRIGQTLKLKSTQPSAPALPAEPQPAEPEASTQKGQKIHVVTAGQTASDIAKRYAIKVSDLLLANAITDPRKLQVNQRLIIPSGDVTTASSNTTLAAQSLSSAPPQAEPPSSVFEEDDDAFDEDELEEDDEDDGDDDAFDAIEATPLIPVTIQPN